MLTRGSVVALGVITSSVALALTGCTSSSDAPNPSESPTASAPQAIKVLANPKNCDAQPLIVNEGAVVITATSTADAPISVNLFAPQDGAFLKRIARIRVLKPNDTKTMRAELTKGAYEITCGDEELTSRKRITAI